MRNIRPSRNLGDARANDVQAIIDAKPVTVQVYRQTGTGFRSDDVQKTRVATFQGRLDPYRSTTREPRANSLGHAMDHLFTLLTRWNADKNGNAIDFAARDEVVISGRAYVVVERIRHDSIKNEGLLVFKQ